MRVYETVSLLAQEIRQALQSRLKGGTLEASDEPPDASSKSKLERVSEVQAHDLPELTSVAIDWWLWEAGEAARSEGAAHHRTLTTFY